MPNTASTYNNDGILVRKSPFDGAFQKVVPTSLHTTILNLALSSVLAGHAGERQIFVSLRRELYWSHMIGDIYTFFRNCSKFPRMGTKFNRQRRLELFPSAGPLEFLAINILRPLSMTKSGSQFVVITAERCIKLIRTLPTTKMTSTQVANIFSED